MARRLILGTAGHIDHGKTALVRALTGTDTDRLPEEKRRGITIDLGFAHLTLPSGDALGIIDVPGHEAFVKNMLAGATGIDLALLVVAADESVMPQTREHLAILELLGVSAGAIAITKADLVDDDWLDLVIAEVGEIVAGGPFGNAPIVAVSARSGRGLPELIAAIESAALQDSRRDGDDLFRLPIDRVFTVRGTGTVVTGTVWSGMLERDQTVRVLPSGRLLRVRGLQAFGHEKDNVVAGERAAVALAGIARDELARGDVLSTGDGWQVSPMLTTRVRLLAASARPLENRQRVRFHLGTAEVLGRAVLLDGDGLAPGDEGWVQLRLETPVVARARDHFVLRAYSPVTTIGGGVVVEPLALRRNRLTGAERVELDQRLEEPAGVAVAAVARAFGGRGVAVSRLAILTPHSERDIRDAVANDPDLLDLDSLIVHIEAAMQCKQLCVENVDQHHATDPLSAGLPVENARRALPRETAPAVFEWALRSLIEKGSITAEAGTLRATSFTPRLDPEQEDACRRFIQTIREGGLAPPTRDELPADLTGRRDFDRLARFLERNAELVLLTQDLWMDPRVIDAAVAASRDRLGNAETLTPGDFKELFGLSRKYLIPLLEYFDRSGFTVRRGDVRALTTVQIQHEVQLPK